MINKNKMDRDEECGRCDVLILAPGNMLGCVAKRDKGYRWN